MKNDKEKEYYGIYFNDDIPKLDKVNKYRKEVQIKFEGRVFLIERDENDKVVERTELENNYKFKKEREYEIEFINYIDKTYHLELKIQLSYWFIFLLLFFVGFIIGMVLCKPKAMNNLSLDNFYSFIDLAVLQLDMDKNELNVKPIGKEDTKEEQKKYNFDVEFNHIASNDINLTDTISAESVVKNKIAPGIGGSFSIIMNAKKSSVDMSYYVKFEDIVKEKPTNLNFQVRGSEKSYSMLQELEKELKGKLNKNSKEEIIIDWQWKYETGEDKNSINENDLLDTSEGKYLESYKFKIIVEGEESE